MPDEPKLYFVTLWPHQRFPVSASGGAWTFLPTAPSGRARIYPADRAHGGGRFRFPWRQRCHYVRESDCRIWVRPASVGIRFSRGQAV